MSHPYATLPLPANPSECSDAQLVQDLAIRLRARLEATVPDLRHRREAIQKLDQAVMVAMGGFIVSPSQRRQ